jgi:regulator of sigma E protease
VAIIAFFVILGPLVLVHEFGHFITARLSKIKVLEFGIGFPPRAKVLHDDGETLYTLNYLPIGGFCRFEGEESDSDDPRSFSMAGLPKQLLVLVAGVAMNVLAAFVLFFAVAWTCNPVVQPRIIEVVPDSPAAAVGLQPGDSVISIDGHRFQLIDLGGDPWNAFNQYLSDHKGQAVVLEVIDSAGHGRTITVNLRVPDEKQPYALGVRFDLDIAYTQGDPASAAGTALTSTGRAMTLIVGALGDLGRSIATNPTSAPPGVSGPVGITEAVGHTLFDYGPALVLLLAAILSANLALINILPIPPFDGGKVVIQVIKRAFGIRGVTAYEIVVNLVGFVLLFVFLGWITFFDLLRIGGG